jgi:hypothetical protein
MSKTPFIVLFSLAALLVVSFQSCYYDREDYLYPNTATSCDTTNVTYTATVSKIMGTYCATPGCHSTTSHASNIILDTYAGTKASAQNANFLGSINHSSGLSAMPQGGSKLSDCDISKLTIWVNKNYPN